MKISLLAGVSALGFLCLAAGMSPASAQPCGYPPFPPCGPPGFRPPPPPPFFYPPPPPPPIYYPPPRAYYGGGQYRDQPRLSYRCKVSGPDCEMNRPRPIGSYCFCRGREGRVAPE